MSSFIITTVHRFWERRFDEINGSSALEIISRSGGGGEIRSINKIRSFPSFLLVSPSPAIQYERC